MLLGTLAFTPGSACQSHEVIRCVVVPSPLPDVGRGSSTSVYPAPGNVELVGVSAADVAGPFAALFCKELAEALRLLRLSERRPAVPGWSGLGKAEIGRRPLAAGVPPSR